MKTIKRLLWFFIISLALSGLSAIPVEQELEFLCRIFPTGSWIGDWLYKVYIGFHDTNTRYPFLAYGYDWLAFAHVVLAILFYGPLKDPVKNIWVIEFGLIACMLILPWAAVTGYLRNIPFGWILIDCSFGVIGFFLLGACYRRIRKIETAQQKENQFSTTY